MPMLRLAAVALVLSAAASASAQSYAGRLQPGDGTLASGEFADAFTVEVAEGDTVRAVVTSNEFDTYVIIKTETGAQAEDDDCTEGETTRSCAELVADVTGTVRVLVTSFQAGETGGYQVEVETVAAGTQVPDSETDGR